MDIQTLPKGCPTSDKKLPNDYGILNHIEADDEVMVDRSFDIEVTRPMMCH